MKSKKLAHTWMIFNNSSDVLMTSFINKKKLEASAILDPPF